MRRVFLGWWLVFAMARGGAASLPEIDQWVGAGHWQAARSAIARELAGTNLDFASREALRFQGDRMRRMQLDFNRTREEVWLQVRALAPTVTAEKFSGWETAGALEFLEVDGTRWYFSQAAKNLFRINSAARGFLSRESEEALFQQQNYRLADLREILTNYDRTGETINTPKTFRVTYRVRIRPEAVPAGEMVRAWLPFPHQLNRQSNIRLVSSDPKCGVVANSNNEGIASVYLEKPAVSRQTTVFQVVFDCTSRAFYEPIDPARVVSADRSDPALKSYLAEQPAQEVFSAGIQALSRQIIGTETNAYRQARLIFQWVYEHLPWASAREYSTLGGLPEYALQNRHGDCGIETMTFMTLCRFNAIPARWESGWATGPTQDMHDWCEIYLAPYGWVPVDVCYGLVNSPVEREKWFYLGGIDGFRVAVNTDHTQPLYPAKMAFRSEIVDFQRGEVEWRGGNLYFDQWDGSFQVAELPPGH